MRSGITNRWLRGSLFLTVLLVLLVESMFVYNFGRSYYGSVQQTMIAAFFLRHRSAENVHRRYRPESRGQPQSGAAPDGGAVCR